MIVFIFMVAIITVVNCMPPERVYQPTPLLSTTNSSYRGEDAYYQSTPNTTKALTDVRKSESRNSSNKTRPNLFVIPLLGGVGLVVLLVSGFCCWLKRDLRSHDRKLNEIFHDSDRRNAYVDKIDAKCTRENENADRKHSYADGKYSSSRNAPDYIISCTSICSADVSNGVLHSSATNPSLQCSEPDRTADREANLLSPLDIPLSSSRVSLWRASASDNSESVTSQSQFNTTHSSTIHRLANLHEGWRRKSCSDYVPPDLTHTATSRKLSDNTTPSKSPTKSLSANFSTHTTSTLAPVTITQEERREFTEKVMEWIQAPGSRFRLRRITECGATPVEALQNSEDMRETNSSQRSQSNIECDVPNSDHHGDDSGYSTTENKSSRV